VFRASTAILLILQAAWAATPEGEAAEAALKRGDTLQAYLLFSQAAELEPVNGRWKLQADALRSKVLSQIRITPGRPTRDRLPSQPPGAFLADISDKDLKEAREPVPPPQLQGKPGRQSFKFKGEAEPVFEKLGALYGLSVIFEKDYQTPPPFSVEMADATWQEAFRAAEAASNSFLIAVTEKVALVVRDTPQKRAEWMPTVAVALPIPERMTVQEAQEILAAIQQTLEVRRIALDPQKRMIFFRDSALKADVARRILRDLMQFRPQVAVEVEFLSSGRSKSLSWGIQSPTQFALMYFTDAKGGYLSLPAIAERVMKSSNYLALGLTGASLFANLTKSSATVMLRSEVVALDGTPTTFHVGDKYPIQSNAYLGNVGGPPGATVYTPPPAVTFEDLGTTLKITPTVHSMDEVTLEVEAEFKALGNGSYNGIPVISARKYQGKVRVKMGEQAVIAGLISFNKSEEKSGMIGLSQIPYLGALLRKNTKEEDFGDVLITLKPQILSLPPGESAIRPVWLGSENHPLTIY
jgi:general secretion pathway protein D